MHYKSGPQVPAVTGSPSGFDSLVRQYYEARHGRMFSFGVISRGDTIFVEYQRKHHTTTQEDSFSLWELVGYMWEVSNEYNH